MTRDSFFEEVTSFGDLIYFCNNHGYMEDEVCDLIYCDDFDDAVYDDIAEFDSDWRTLRDLLCDLDTGYSWYCRRGMLYYEGLTEYDFEEWRNQLVAQLDDDGFFEPNDNEQEEQEEAPCPVVEEPEPDEPEIEEVSIDGIGDWISASWGVMMDARPKPKPAEEQAEPEYEEEEPEIELEELLPF